MTTTRATTKTRTIEQDTARLAELRDAIQAHDFEVERAAVAREHDFALDHAPQRTLAEQRTWLDVQISAFNQRFGPTLLDGTPIKRPNPFRGNVVDPVAQAMSQAQQSYDHWQAQIDALDAEAVHWDQNGNRVRRIFDADPTIEAARTELTELADRIHDHQVAEATERRDQLIGRMAALEALRDAYEMERSLTVHEIHQAIESGAGQLDELHETAEALGRKLAWRESDLGHLAAALDDVRATWPDRAAMLPRQPQERDIVQCRCARCRGTGRMVA